ncbi:TlpA family protein disulfide reductase [Methylobacillus gramineus]|uniref:TlpA disulfide reductase family protein n=1 Tax=Methylobacillus gramineus TaxID=755169 RepID=UPI001CFFC1DF|nr:TlpA disulfide reductase family protein [Methylobacillus gramineus]MCB5183854.1 TlpA family protein disulfide reductase [Methylobacillus gramineus]
MKRGLIVLLIGMLHICAYAGEGPWGFTLPTLDGSRFVDLRHTPKPALVNFWGVDCPPCIHELPALDQFAARHSTWSVWLVNTDAAALAQRFIDQHPVQSTVLRSGMNVSGLMRAAGNRTGALPFTLVIDSKQAICFRKAGALIALDFAYMQQNCH